MILAGGLCLLTAPLLAAAPSTLSQEGVSLKLVALAADPSGRVRGALQIDLEPGWKTYWIAPGPVGLAPMLNFERSTGIAKPTISYPVPVRFREGAEVSIGFEGPTAFAFEAQATGQDLPMIRLDLMIGVCRDICVPVTATLETPPEKGLNAQAAIASAFAALPSEAQAEGDEAATLTPDGRSLRISMPMADPSTSADVYVAGPEGWSFGEPVRVAESQENGRVAFDMPVVTRPAAPKGRLQVDVLLTSGQSARLSRSLEVEQR